MCKKIILQHLHRQTHKIFFLFLFPVAKKIVKPQKQVPARDYPPKLFSPAKHKNLSNRKSNFPGNFLLAWPFDCSGPTNKQTNGNICADHIMSHRRRTGGGGAGGTCPPTCLQMVSFFTCERPAFQTKSRKQMQTCSQYSI